MCGIRFMFTPGRRPHAAQRGNRPTRQRSAVMKTHGALLVAVTALLSGVVLISAPAGDMTARIRAEGQQRSQALVMFRTLTDDIAPRLTGSPAHARAAQWALDRFTEWGLAGAHLEPY